MTEPYVNPLAAREPDLPKAQVPTAAELLAAYQAAVDYKFDHTLEGTSEWRLADEECDRLCYAFVVASHAERGEAA